MFIKFQRDTTAVDTGSSEIIVNSEAITDMSTVVVEDRRLNVNSPRTRIAVFSFPDFFFNTKSSFEDIATVISIVDTTTGIPTNGSQCVALGAMQAVYPSVWYPFVKFNVWQNNTNEIKQRVIALSALVSAEPTTYFDKRNGDIHCVKLVIREAEPLTLYTDLSFVDVCNLLKPLDIPFI